MASRFTHPIQYANVKLLPPAGQAKDLDTVSLDDGYTRYGRPGLLYFSEKYSLSGSPSSWGTPILMMDEIEPDDVLHNPDSKRDCHYDNGFAISSRGLLNLGCLLTLLIGLMALFAGYPIYTHITSPKQTKKDGFNLGGINATGQLPSILGGHSLIDPDTPLEVYTKPSYHDPSSDLILVFSDEFNQEGRTFYSGDDPYWEAADLHYWGTDNLEWYDPVGAITANGSLKLTLTETQRIDNHNMTYRGAMIQTWNKFCFTGGLLETSVQMPGENSVLGLWPAVWAMGNLGRAGYGASLEGMWPYSYDSCDVGTLPNQTYPGTLLPEAANQNTDPKSGGSLSFLPGQRLSACTCPGESHPGPMRADGTYVGRSAPEIDVFEASVSSEVGGQVSQSGQWAPFNDGWRWNFDDTSNYNIDNPNITYLNSYLGGVYQQATSAVSTTNQDCYEMNAIGCFAVYGFEYKPGFDGAYITWINDDKRSWTMYQSGVGPDATMETGSRPIPQEPMYIIANLGISHGFGWVDFEHLVFPTTMSVDYIRVYQPRDAVNIGCDPIDYPTSAYIKTYSEAYTNANLTIWEEYGQPWPKNKLANGGTCD